jgi:hypothetical protein
MGGRVRMFGEHLRSDASGYEVGAHVWHVTPADRLRAIRRVGLLPQDGVSIDGRPFRNRLYFATSRIAAYDISVNFQSHGRAEEYFMLKVDSAGIARGHHDDPLFAHGVWVDYPVGPGYVVGYEAAADAYGEYDEDDLDNLYL